MNPRATIITLTLLLTLLGCSNDDIFENLAIDRELVVVTRNSPTTYYFDGDQPAGFEYELLKAFADARGYRLRFQVAFTIEELLATLDDQKAHLAAAGLTVTPDRSERFLTTRPYLNQSPLIIYKSGNQRPRKLQDLIGRDLVVLAGSSHAELLKRLSKRVPGLSWREVQAGDTLELMQLVTLQKAELAVIDSAEFKIQQQLYPRLVAAMDLEAEEAMAWHLPKTPAAAALVEDINAFFIEAGQSGVLETIRERHFGATRFSSRVGAFTFNRRVTGLLPKWQPMIEAVAIEYQMDWRLLAAVSYQESHWNPKARSRTGVEGMMMITRATARELGVTDRLDPQQSLRGGARFIRNLLRRLPPDIEEPNRLWMALAAYNIGLGHLEDARVLAEKRGLDPHLWPDVRAQLTDLQNPDIYPTTRFGFARGAEAVTYVDNIRQYYATLQLITLTEDRIQPPIDVSNLLTNTHQLPLPLAL